MSEKVNVLEWDGKLGNTSFSKDAIEKLQSVTVEEAIEIFANDAINANRVVNAWKKANPGKSAKKRNRS